MKLLLVFILLLGTIPPALVTASWLFTESLIQHTSEADFCAGCHSMQPMAAAYRDSLHGGNNPHGVQAVCVDCHLPHDNPGAYLYRKVVIGLRDSWTEFTTDVSAIDWEARRAHREDFVYDSGCLRCHRNLQQATANNPAAAAAHEAYFLGTLEMTCVACHQHVGHRDLTRHLQEAADR